MVSTKLEICFLLAQHFMRQIVEGMLYLHSHGILHRDLTLANLLLTRNMNVVSVLFLVLSVIDNNTYMIHVIYN